MWLTNGTVYLMAGYIWQGKLQLFLRDLIEDCSQLHPNQRVGISHFYGQNCECRISPCVYDCRKLVGCHGDWPWEKRCHSYCVKNADGTACSWHDSAEHKNYTSEHENYTSERENYSSEYENYTSEYENYTSRAVNKNTFVLLYLLVFVSVSNTTFEL